MDRFKLAVSTLTFLIIFFGSIPGLCDDEHHAGSLFDGDWSGEIGLRYILENNAGIEESDFQLQFALDYSAELSNSLDALIGLRTGTIGRPTRGWINQDLFFEQNTFYLKPLEITHHGSVGSCETETSIGVFDYPFEQSGLLFDNDFMRQGITQTYNFDLNGDDLELGWSAQYLQNGDNHGDAWTVSGNFEYAFNHPDDSSTSIQISYVDFLNEDTLGEAIVQGRLDVSGNVSDLGTNNQINDSGDYLSDFGLLFFRLEQDWNNSTPIEIAFEYVNNLEFESSDGAGDEGFSLSFEIGDTRDAGDWEFDLMYLEIENDAVLDLYNKGKFGTNTRGWTSGISYQVFDELELFIDTYWMETNTVQVEFEDFNNRIIQIGMKYEF